MARENTEEDLASEIKDEPSVTHKRAPLPPEMEQEIEVRRQQNVLAATIAGLSWGRSMSPVIRRAFAAYCANYDVDPITEMDNLGGNPYINADWYKRKLGELIVRGVVKDYTLEHVHADPRLRLLFEDDTLPQEMRDQARRKWFDNLMRRIDQNAPDEAEAVCICTIHLPNGTKAVGCKWAGGGTSVLQPRHNGQAQPNPIAEMNPALSVESMSIRRALSQLLTHVSGQRVSELQWTAKVVDMNDELSDLGKAARAENPPPPADQREPGETPLLSAEYATGEDAADLARRIAESRGAEVKTEVVTGTRKPDPRMVQFLDASEDPYGFEKAKTAPATELETLRAIEKADQRSASTVSTLPASDDLFGVTSPVEDAAVECEVCENMIRPGHPEDHDKLCDGYRE